MFKVAIVRSNSLLYDPMLPKIIRSVSRRYCTTLLGWNREGFGKKKMQKSTLMKSLGSEFGSASIRIFNMGGPAGTSTLLLYYPFFWSWIFLQLCLARPQLVHACDLDTFIPCYFYKVMLRKKMIFYIHDRFAMAFISERRKLLYRLVNFLEEDFASKADFFITVTKSLMNTFRKIPRKYEIIMNCCEDKSLGRRSKSDLFTIAFTGHITKRRGLGIVLSIVGDMDKTVLIAAGKVADQDLLEQIKRTKNAEYIGLLTPAEALKLEARSDVMFALYDLKATQDIHALPLKLWEAMMCGIPIITNVANEILTEVDCGIFVNYNDTSQIRNALLTLKENRALCSKLGANGRNAFLERYNWCNMEQKLYEIYEGLLHDSDE